MAIKTRDIYKGRKKSKARPWIIAGIVLALLLILIGVFYGVRGLCVYDEAGNATIIWPWEERPEASPSPSVALPAATEPDAAGLIPQNTPTAGTPTEGTAAPSETAEVTGDGETTTPAEGQ